MIEFIKLSFSYKDMEQNSLRELYLNIPKGQCVLLCGASGCGKTTLTRLVNGLIPHFFVGNISGKVIVKGMNVGETEIQIPHGVLAAVFHGEFVNLAADSVCIFVVVAIAGRGAQQGAHIFIAFEVRVNGLDQLVHAQLLLLKDQLLHHDIDSSYP